MQWCVEEACLEAYEQFEAGVKADMVEKAAADAAVADAQERARRSMEQLTA